MNDKTQEGLFSVCEHDFSDYSYCEKCDTERSICTKCGEDEGNYIINSICEQRDQVIAERDGLKNLDREQCCEDFKNTLIEEISQLKSEIEQLKAQLAKADRWQGTEFPVRFTLRDLVITIDRGK